MDNELKPCGTVTTKTQLQHDDVVTTLHDALYSDNQVSILELRSRLAPTRPRRSVELLHLDGGLVSGSAQQLPRRRLAQAIASALRS